MTLRNNELDYAKRDSRLHYEPKTHENPMNILMGKPQVFHAFSTAFSWANFSGFSWVNVMKIPLKMPSKCC